MRLFCLAATWVSLFAVSLAQSGTPGTTFNDQNKVPESCQQKPKRVETAKVGPAGGFITPATVPTLEACATACSTNTYTLVNPTPKIDKDCILFVYTPKHDDGPSVNGPYCYISTEEQAPIDATNNRDIYGKIKDCAAGASSSTSSTSSTSSGASSSTTPMSTTPDKFEGLSAADKKKVCCEWAKGGECDKNPFFMRPKCPDACGTAGCTVPTAISCKVTVSAECGGSGTPSGDGSGSGSGGSGSGGSGSGDCQDSAGPQCPQWAASGECDANPFYMKVFCQGACKSCGATAESLAKEIMDPKCKNSYGNDAQCSFWSTRNECTTNAGWMRANCESSCKACPPSA